MLKTAVNDENKENYLRDLLVKNLFFSGYIIDENLLNATVQSCAEFIQYFYNNFNIDIDIAKFVDFSLKVDKERVKVSLICNNLLTALWFTNLYPKDFLDVISKNYYKYNDKIITFNKKKNKLIYKNIVS
jgi:hypothetical protein